MDHDGNSDGSKMAELLHKEKPLRLVIHDRLTMVIENMGFDASGRTRLHKMKNLETHQVGLVPDHLVGKTGTAKAEA